jgi:hypothetical protein
MSDNIYNVVGVFISLKCKIPKIGDLGLDSRSIYITAPFVNKECFTLLFKFMKIKILETTETKQSYVIKENVYTLIQQIYNLSHNIEQIVRSVTTIRQNAKNTIAETEDLMSSFNSFETVVKLIKNEFKDIIPDTAATVLEKERIRLKEYIQTKGIKNIKKKDLLEKFPLLTTEIGSVTLKDIEQLFK